MGKEAFILILEWEVVVAVAVGVDVVSCGRQGISVGIGRYSLAVGFIVIIIIAGREGGTMSSACG